MASNYNLNILRIVARIKQKEVLISGTITIITPKDNKVYFWDSAADSTDQAIVSIQDQQGNNVTNKVKSIHKLLLGHIGSIVLIRP